MTPPDMEFADLRTLAFMYNSSKEVIRDTAKKLIEKGYGIDVLEWGGQGKFKINQRQFRSALMKEFRAKL